MPSRSAILGNRLAGAIGRNTIPKKTVTSFRGEGLVVNVEVESIKLSTLYGALQWAVSGTSLAEFLDGAHDYFREEIALRFAYEGDAKSGPWAPLHDATVDIRRALGYGGEEPINRRTDQMFEWITSHYNITNTGTSAELNFPGDAPDPILQAKLRTAQRGSDSNPLGYGPTQPRPVLAVDQSDLITLLGMLEAHIIYQVIGGLGTSTGYPAMD